MSELLIKIIAVIVTLLTCYAFYQLRISTSKDQSFADSMKVIQAASEIVKNISEKAMPNLRSRIDELESRGRILEQNQRRMLSSESGTIIPSATTTTTSDAEILAARRAQRGGGVFSASTNS